MKVFAIVLLLLCADVSNAQPRQPQQFQVRPSDSPYFPGDNTPAVVDTSCFVTYDRRTVFVACRALEPDVAALRANLGDRDLPREDDTVDVAAGRLFTARLTQGQVVYHLNLRTFVRAILQYTDITRDPALFVFPVASETRQLFSQYLFSYKLNPQTVFLAGYSDNASGTQTVDLTRTDRTFFLKIGYAWVG